MTNLLAIGIVLIIGVIGARLIRKLKQPSIIGWLIVGAILGPSVLGWLSKEVLDSLGFIADITLGFVGFIIGTQITIGALRRLGKGIIILILAECIAAFTLVFLGVWILTHSISLALIFGGLACATAPAGTVAVLEEYRAKGPLTKTLYIVVGADDAVAVIICVFATAYAKIIIGGEKLSILTTIGKPLIEIALAIGIGGAIGIIFGLFTQKVREDAILLSATIGAILLCVGLAEVMHFSLILANMALSMVIVNTFPRVSARTYRLIEAFVPPFFVCFFALAGAHFNLPVLMKMGIIGVAYIMCRSIGKMGGTWLGALIGKRPAVIRKYLGFGMLSQAGVALGLAYLIVREFASLGDAGEKMATLAITIIAATTIAFEIIGPIGVKFAITKAGEIRAQIQR
ncbi:MAG: cation:proton antiporter [bacterium]|nr:cation:proton antiporter [bacterium]